MTISEIRRAEASLECKAAALSKLFPPVHRQAFEFTLEGVLGKENVKDQMRAAYNWMNSNYELVSAVIYAAIDLSEDIYQGLCDFDLMLMQHKEAKEDHHG